jgi:hypothetical protein
LTIAGRREADRIAAAGSMMKVLMPTTAPRTFDQRAPPLLARANGERPVQEVRSSASPA